MSNHKTPFIYKLIDMPWFFISMTSLISCIGFIALYSAAQGSIDPWASRQMVRFAIAVPLMIIIALIDIRFWFHFAYFGYALGLILLFLVDIIGTTGMGAQRWLSFAGFNFQPSELMKVFLIIALARYFQLLHWSAADRVISLIIPGILIAVSAFLVLRQPNLGTASIMVMASAILFFLGGVSWKKFAIAGIAFLALLPVVWNHMHDYQRQRVHTFLNPESDPLGAGYNIIQSKIAIGSGGFFGKGFLKGTQSQLSFVPEKQTDFIFSILAEEYGFVGSVGILILYAMLITAGMKIALQCESLFGKLVSFGITIVLFLHVFINMGMVSGILPVVGVPLPLLSYGGSSMISTLIGFGFIVNAYVYRNTQIETEF